MLKNRKETVHVSSLLNELRLGLAEARLNLVAAGIAIPQALQNSIIDDPIGEIRKLVAREKMKAKKEYARGYHEGWKLALVKFKELRGIPTPPTRGGAPDGEVTK